jgi:hypothetical protein
MQEKKYNIPQFINGQKYIFIVLLVVALGVSYLIQQNLFKLGLNPENGTTSISDKDRTVILDEYQYFIKTDREFGNLQLVFGNVFEKLGIEKNLNNKKTRYVPNSQQSNNYYFFIVKTLDPIDEENFIGLYELEKNKYINNNLEWISEFRKLKNKEDILEQREYQFFKLRNAKVSITEEKSTKEIDIADAKKKIIKYGNIDRTQEYLANEITKITNTTDTKIDKTFYYPEVIILIFFTSYLSIIFLIQMIRESD